MWPGETPTIPSVAVHRDESAYTHLDAAVRKQRRLKSDLQGRVEDAHATPGRRKRIRGGANEDSTPGRRIEIGEKRRHARRAAHQSRDVAVGARPICLAKRDVAVGIHERVRLHAAEVGKAERHALLHAVIVAKRHAVADLRTESGIDADDVEASCPWHETKAPGLKVEGVGLVDQIAFVLDHGHIADVHRGRGRDGRTRRKRTLRIALRWFQNTLKIVVRGSGSSSTPGVLEAPLPDCFGLRRWLNGWCRTGIHSLGRRLARDRRRCSRSRRRSRIRRSQGRRETLR